MAIELVTGRAGRAHVDSSDVRVFNAYATASGRYVLHGGGAEIESANDLHVLPAEILMDGAHVRITGTGEELTLENGASSYDRIDIVALHYVSVGGEDSRVESVTLEVIRGTPVDTGTGAQDPEMPVTGSSILDGSSDVYVPYIKVKITGLVPGNPEVLLPGRVQMVKDMIAGITLEDISGTLPVAKGGTGSNSGAGALNNLGIKKWLLDNVFKVGYVWISYTDTSPSGLVGGTWTSITGVFPYFNAGTGTGGANSQKLSVGQLPSHKHQTNGGTWIAHIGKAVGSTQGAWQTTIDSGSYAILTTPSYTDSHLTGVSTGNGDSINNMPAYQTLYAWRRTA